MKNFKEEIKNTIRQALDHFKGEVYSHETLDRMRAVVENLLSEIRKGGIITPKVIVESDLDWFERQPWEIRQRLLNEGWKSDPSSLQVEIYWANE
jgi:predicted Ser/Thr protein kinase